MIAYPHIEHRDGRAWVAGTRVRVLRLWSWWDRGQGLSVAGILRRYPQIPPAKVLTALAWAQDHQEELEREVADDRARLEAMGRA
jgi:uncharacterized protein (DUF433 family)